PALWITIQGALHPIRPSIDFPPIQVGGLPPRRTSVRRALSTINLICVLSPVLGNPFEFDARAPMRLGCERAASESAATSFPETFHGTWLETSAGPRRGFLSLADSEQFRSAPGTWRHRYGSLIVRHLPGLNGPACRWVVTPGRGEGHGRHGAARAARTVSRCS